MTNFYQSLAEAFNKRPDAPALILKDRPDWSYGDLIDRVNQLAQVLLANEVEPGDRVMVQVAEPSQSQAGATLALGVKTLHAFDKVTGKRMLGRSE